ncbi:DNA mismatch repair protein MLH1 isoform X1, partial [Tanacetum coccineum]
VTYRDGVMESEPKACAAVKGTQIMIENLFYNMVARRKTLQEHLLTITQKLTLTNAKKSVCNSITKNGAFIHYAKSMGPSTELMVPLRDCMSSRLDAIRSVYGVSVARNLIKVDASDSNPSSSVFEMDGLISNSNYSAKKTTMVLFINERLVECSALKRAIEIVYAATLPKASKPFIYMSIVLPPDHVDVNVHPTKREVSLLNQEVIVEKIQSTIEMKLRSFNEAGTYQEQAVDSSPISSVAANKVSPMNTSTSGSQKLYPHQKVRTNLQDPSGRMHAYLQVKPSRNLESSGDLNSIRSSIRQRRNPKETADLTSVQELINEFEHGCHSGLLDIVRNCTYVGMADDVFALLQHNTQLYLANVVNLSKELMYQLVLQRFGYFNAIQLSDPVPLQELITLALKEEDPDSDATENDDLKGKIAEMNAKLLTEKTEMLDEYFGIYVDTQGNLSRLPVILDQHTPDMDRVPEFALCLGNDVLWNNEKVCFQTIAAALGNFYAMHPPLLPNPSGDNSDFYKKGSAQGKGNVSEGNDMVEDGVDNELLSKPKNVWAQREWSVQHVLFPSMRFFFKPPTSMATNGTFVQVALSGEAYMVFERCVEIIPSQA